MNELLDIKQNFKKTFKKGPKQLKNDFLNKFIYKLRLYCIYHDAVIKTEWLQSDFLWNHC